MLEAKQAAVAGTTMAQQMKHMPSLPTLASVLCHIATIAVVRRQTLSESVWRRECPGAKPAESVRFRMVSCEFTAYV